MPPDIIDIVIKAIGLLVDPIDILIKATPGLGGNPSKLMVLSGFFIVLVMGWEMIHER